MDQLQTSIIIHRRLDLGNQLIDLGVIAGALNRLALAGIVTDDVVERIGRGPVSQSSGIIAGGTQAGEGCRVALNDFNLDADLRKIILNNGGNADKLLRSCEDGESHAAWIAAPSVQIRLGLVEVIGERAILAGAPVAKGDRGAVGDCITI